jgi:prepilin-type processing-associated H-X9-DG protein
MQKLMQRPENSPPIIAHESLQDWTDGVAAVFVDGHVQVIWTQAQFDELLARAKDAKDEAK